MKIDVETLDDNCRYCPKLEIETFNVCDKPIVFRCKHLRDCITIAEMMTKDIAEQMEQNVQMNCTRGIRGGKCPR